MLGNISNWKISKSILCDGAKCAVGLVTAVLKSLSAKFPGIVSKIFSMSARTEYSSRARC